MIKKSKVFPLYDGLLHSLHRNRDLAGGALATGYRTVWRKWGVIDVVFEF
jgi:hypothetical protein